MAHGAQITANWWLLAGIGALFAPLVPFSTGLSAQSLSVRLDGDNLHVSAPQLRFLAGKPLARIQDGASVAFVGQLSVSLDANATLLNRALERFVISYDLWEEKFSVTKLGRARRSVSHLSSTAAEAWCLDNLTLDTSVLPRDKTFWIRLELRAEEPREQSAVLGEPGINLTRLIEIFSRPARAQQPHWILDTGPLRFAELKRG